MYDFGKQREAGVMKKELIEEAITFRASGGVLNF
jgi:hypothetical protein